MKIYSILLCLPLALAAACGDDGGNDVKKDAGVIDAPGHIDAPPGTADAAPDASCFTNPTTNDEIINACTDVTKIFKDSHPPLLGSDGTLPPLP